MTTQLLSPATIKQILAADECRIADHRRPGATHAVEVDAEKVLGHVENGSARFSAINHFDGKAIAFFSWK